MKKIFIVEERDIDFNDEIINTDLEFHILEEYNEKAEIIIEKNNVKQNCYSYITHTRVYKYNLDEIEIIEKHFDITITNFHYKQN